MIKHALLLAMLFACTSGKQEAETRDPDPISGSPSPSNATARRAADDKATELEQARGAAKADIATAHALADDATAKLHAETAAQLQKNFDAADRRFTALEEKAANATGSARKLADAARAEAKTHSASVMAGIAKLRDATGAAWDATRTQVDSDTAALNRASDSLELALK